jgi:hypothetical protein
LTVQLEFGQAETKIGLFMDIMSKSIKQEFKGWTYWVNEQGKYHREDGPAIIWRNGLMQWRVNGKRHRLDGPAAISNIGKTTWFVNDTKIYIY